MVCMRMGLMLLTSFAGDSIHQPLQEVTACDELRISAPSLLNFADTLYPIYLSLLESIKPIIQHNLRRISKHSNSRLVGTTHRSRVS